MKLLVITQTVDSTDPVLGFFHRWLEEFAKYAERIEVICLTEGAHQLPANVRVHSLGKRTGREQETGGRRFGNRLRYTVRFFSLIWALRNEYGTVFVHMNPEYVVLGGLLWRLLGKPVGLWYTHKSVTRTLRIAERLADVIFTASKESFRLPSSKVHIVGHGIDTDFFSPDQSLPREKWILSVGRLMPSKRHDMVVRAAACAGRELHIAGEGSERGRLEAIAQETGSRVRFLGGLTQTQLREEYRKTAVFIHTSETGSLDKVVLEALATNTPVITTSDVFTDFPVDVVDQTPEDIAKNVAHLRERTDRVETVRNNHSLSVLIPNVVRILSSFRHGTASS